MIVSSAAGENPCLEPGPHSPASGATRRRRVTAHAVGLCLCGRALRTGRLDLRISDRAEGLLVEGVLHRADTRGYSRTVADPVSDVEMSVNDDVLRRALLGWLDGVEAIIGEDSRQDALRWFIRELDRVVASDGESTTLAVQALTRAIAAAGRVLVAKLGLGKTSPVWLTVAAADRYTARPCEDTYEAYIWAATDSYPYGAGDGCLRIIGDESCAPGSGCVSGAGSLEQVAITTGASAVLGALSVELRPWLCGVTTRQAD